MLHHNFQYVLGMYFLLIILVQRSWSLRSLQIQRQIIARQINKVNKHQIKNTAGPKSRRHIDYYLHHNGEILFEFFVSWKTCS